MQPAPTTRPSTTIGATASTTLPSVVSTTTRPEATPVAGSHFAVTSMTRTFEHGDRPLVTTIYTPLGSAGRWPLFVWVHGLDSTPGFYADLAREIARRGVIVAVPQMPRTHLGVPGDNFDDYVNQPADISFLLDRLLGTLPIDAARVAVGGHSLGAMTTVGLVADRCCLDRRVKAAVEVDGARRPFPNGAPLAHRVPTLWIHGDADTTFPVDESHDMFEAAASPKFLVVLRGVQHTPWRVPGAGPVVQDAIERFLDEYLIGRPGGADALRGPGAGIAVYRSE
jgi:predicted dienelactone hydrolase